MAVSLQCRSPGMVMKEEVQEDDDLAIFLELCSREKETTHIFTQNSNDFDDQLGSKQHSFLIPKAISTSPAPKTAADDFLNLENYRTDYDWLLTPPGKPVFSSLDMEMQKIAMGQIGILEAHSAVPKSELANPPAEPAPNTNETSSQPVSLTGSDSSMAANRRPSSIGGLKPAASRSATPTGRSPVPSKTKPSKASTPTSRATLPTSAKARASTPASRATLPSTRPTLRSSTPTRPMARSSTPTSRPSVLAASKPTSRSTTPTLKNRVAKLSTPTYLKISMPERQVSASGGGPVAPSALLSSRGGRVSNGSSHINGRYVVAMSRSDLTCNDDVSPVVMGTKMVERVVNMRKLAPPKQNGFISKKKNSSEKSLPSQENSGFGRTLSRSSLEMALRHMDISRSIPGNLRPLVTNISDSSYSVGSGSSKSRTTASVSDSPLATSSNASSEPSFNNSSNYFDGSEAEDTRLANEIGHSDI